MVDVAVNISRLRETLVRQEGEVNHAYQDSEGYWTIGVGRLIDKRRGGGLSHEEAMMLLDNDIHRSMGDLFTHHPEVHGLDDARMEVLINMTFNMGIGKLSGFKNMWAAIQDNDFDRAAAEMLDSTWARQVGERADELAEQMRTGVCTHR